jgi:hypothetical protein
MSKGTYVALRVLPPACTDIRAFCEEVGIINNTTPLEDRLHATIMHSQKHCPSLEVDGDTVHEATFKGYEIFKNRDGGTALVMLLNAPTVVARHHRLMNEHDAVFDFAEFIPHITLAYEFPSDTVDGIPPFTLPIRLGHEYIEDLDLEWTPS